MHKYLVTLKSANPITGPILVTTSIRQTCPQSCSLKNSRCYAETGYLGHFLWPALNRAALGSTFANNIAVRSLSELLGIIRSLPEHAIWRHNQAGDLMWEIGQKETISATTLRLLISANHGRRGFTFTHHDVISNHTNRALIHEANSLAFTVNLSADNLDHADTLAALHVAPVATVVDRLQNHYTPKGRKVVICPARTHKGVTCSSCRLCTRQRDFIIGLPDLHKFPLQGVPHFAVAPS